MNNIERLKKVKCFLFDMDGTIILGNTIIPGLEDFFKKLTAAGRTFYLVTNNSSNDHSYYLRKMNALGFDITKNNVLISTDAFTNWLRKTNKEARLHVLGTQVFRETLAEEGFHMTSTFAEGADYVVIAFDRELTYTDLAVACRLIDKGVPYVATHPDVRCPIEGGEFIPDTGAMIDLIKKATGKSPLHIFGKPYKFMLDVVLDRTGFSKDQVAMVGDRLSTDIAFGLQNDILSVLVLTGEAKLEDIEKENIHPDIILNHAKEILQYL